MRACQLISRSSHPTKTSLIEQKRTSTFEKMIIFFLAHYMYCFGLQTEDVLSSPLDQHDEALASELQRIFVGSTVGVFDSSGGSGGWYINFLQSKSGVDNVHAIRIEERTDASLATYDWLLSLETAGHVAAANEEGFFKRIAQLARKGVVLSWTTFGQPRCVRENCHSNSYVVQRMLLQDFVFHVDQSSWLRFVCDVTWLKHSLMVFEKQTLTLPVRTHWNLAAENLETPLVRIPSEKGDLSKASSHIQTALQQLHVQVDCSVDDRGCIGKNFRQLFVALRRLGMLQQVRNGNEHIPRVQMENFLLRMKQRLLRELRQPAACLEWGTWYMTSMLKADLCPVHLRTSLEFATTPSRHRDASGLTHVRGNIEVVEDLIPEQSISLIVCTEVFEHLRFPSAAMQTLRRWLVVGGFVIWVAPFMYRHHNDHDDFYRFSSSAARLMAETAGFEVVVLETAGTLDSTHFFFLGGTVSEWTKQQTVDFNWTSVHSPLGYNHVYMLLKAK